MNDKHEHASPLTSTADTGMGTTTMNRMSTGLWR
jgi:hypothetical protein